MSIDRINLKISTRIDPELLDKNIPLKFIRLIIWIRLKTNEGWTTTYEAIVDTGNPITVIPYSCMEQGKGSLAI